MYVRRPASTRNGEGLRWDSYSTKVGTRIFTVYKTYQGLVAYSRWPDICLRLHTFASDMKEILEEIGSPNNVSHLQAIKLVKLII